MREQIYRNRYVFMCFCLLVFNLSNNYAISYYEFFDKGLNFFLICKFTPVLKRLRNSIRCIKFYFRSEDFMRAVLHKVNSGIYKFRMKICFYNLKLLERALELYLENSKRTLHRSSRKFKIDNQLISILKKRKYIGQNLICPEGGSYYCVVSGGKKVKLNCTFHGTERMPLQNSQLAFKINNEILTRLFKKLFLIINTYIKADLENNLLLCCFLKFEKKQSVNNTYFGILVYGTFELSLVKQATLEFLSFMDKIYNLFYLDEKFNIFAILKKSTARKVFFYNGAKVYTLSGLTLVLNKNYIFLGNINRIKERINGLRKNILHDYTFKKLCQSAKAKDFFYGFQFKLPLFIKDTLKKHGSFFWNLESLGFILKHKRAYLNLKFNSASMAKKIQDILTGLLITARVFLRFKQSESLRYGGSGSIYKKVCSYILNMIDSLRIIRRNSNLNLAIKFFDTFKNVEFLINLLKLTIKIN